MRVRCNTLQRDDQSLKKSLVPVTNPTATPTGTEFESSQQVTLNCATTGATIMYTTDGSEPSATNGTKYTEPLTLSSTTTLKFYAFKTGMADSEVVTETYTKQGS